MLHFFGYVLAGIAVVAQVASQFWSPSMLVKGFWIFAITISIIASAGLFTLAAHQSEQKITNLQTDIRQLTEKIDALVGLTKVPPLVVQTLPQEVIERARKGELKAQAQELSTQILQFLTDRTRGEPLLPRPNTWQQDVDQMIRYLQETVALYTERFGAKAIAMRDKLAEAGLQDPQLDALVEHPTNPIGIRLVAERLAVLAERLN